MTGEHKLVCSTLRLQGDGDISTPALSMPPDQSIPRPFVLKLYLEEVVFINVLNAAVQFELF